LSRPKIARDGNSCGFITPAAGAAKPKRSGGFDVPLAALVMSKVVHMSNNNTPTTTAAKMKYLARTALA